MAPLRKAGTDMIPPTPRRRGGDISIVARGVVTFLSRFGAALSGLIAFAGRSWCQAKLLVGRQNRRSRPAEPAHFPARRKRLP